MRVFEPRAQRRAAGAGAGPAVGTSSRLLGYARYSIPQYPTLFDLTIERWEDRFLFPFWSDAQFHSVFIDIASVR